MRMFWLAVYRAVVREAGLWPPLSLLNNKQCRYRYRVHSALKSQPARDIIPVTPCHGEEQVQSGELAAGDEYWFKLIGRGRETLGQQLTRTMAEATSIDKTASTEHTEWMELETFPGCITPFAGNKEKGAEEVKMHSEGSDEISF